MVALDPLTGQQEWAFNPRLPADFKPTADFVCRGVVIWQDAHATPDAACGTRVALATLDARMIELDLATAIPCEGFGEHGTVTPTSAPPPLYPGEPVLDSPPAVLGNALLVGSAVNDMTRARTPGAGVRALDARTGAPRWQIDPSPARGGVRLSGGGNVWAPIAVDAASGVARICSPPRWWRWTAPPAGRSGASRRHITRSGTPTWRRSRGSPRSAMMEGTCRW